MDDHTAPALCPGIGSDAEGWHHECESCARLSDKPQSWGVIPPKVIVFFCPYHMEKSNG